MYTPKHLKKWTFPRDYSWATWEGYYVAPVGRHRDSDILTNSNWDSQWETLKPLQADIPDEDATSPVQVCANHWAVGWVEWVAIHESNEAALKAADAIAERLEDYPVLDDDDCCQREHEDYLESWKFYGCRDFIGELYNELDFSSCMKDFLHDADSSDVLGFFQSLIPGGDFYHAEGGGVSINIGYAVKHCTRKKLSDFIRELRSTVTA